MSVMEVDSVYYKVKGDILLSDIYLQVKTGQVIGLLGRNGSGKSSLLRVIFGTLSAESSSLRIDKKYVRKAFKKEGVMKYLPQSALLFPYLTIDKAVDIFVKGQRNEFYESLPSVLDVKSKVGDLSGGLRRYVEVALLLFSGAKFILLDEPFSQLSPVLIESICNLIKQRAKYAGIIITDHYYQYVCNISSELYLLGNQSIKKITHEDELIYMGYKI